MSFGQTTLEKQAWIKEISAAARSRLVGISTVYRYARSPGQFLGGETVQVTISG